MRPAEQKKRRDETIDDPTKRNKIEFYYYLLDIVITSLEERFSQLKAHCDYFDFLYNIDERKNTPPDRLDTKCRNLAEILQDHESSDIDALELKCELKGFQHLTVASGKRSFSKLKLIKTYLLSTMNKIHFTDLATVSIKNELVEDIHYTDHVKEFAQAKARKIRFVY
ncbi:uncharacterized protein LOC126297983 [Schistocerca gregaria]|uniref:uncharacterized protein LOC126297983 n=1 Tax=Schistocerca gregaria TaxID=7010 RepID=UPI00211EE8D8|nr:uncharacterized protein LOC126297983 [Schistocerca gregaria]